MQLPGHVVSDRGELARGLGEQICQADFTSAFGVAAVRWSIFICRIAGYFAAAISSAGLRLAATDHSMFDWPEQSQTSPTRTSSARGSDVFLALRPNLEGQSLGICGHRGSSTFQRPSPPAFVSTGPPPSETFTVLPGSAQPHTGIGTSRWKTM